MNQKLKDYLGEVAKWLCIVCIGILWELSPIRCSDPPSPAPFTPGPFTPGAHAYADGRDIAPPAFDAQGHPYLTQRPPAILIKKGTTVLGEHGVWLAPEDEIWVQPNQATSK